MCHSPFAIRYSPFLKPHLIPAARAVNDGMPLHMVDLTVDELVETVIDASGKGIERVEGAYLRLQPLTCNLHTCPLATGMKRLWTLTAATIALLGILLVLGNHKGVAPTERRPDQHTPHHLASWTYSV